MHCGSCGESLRRFDVHCEACGTGVLARSFPEGAPSAGGSAAASLAVGALKFAGIAALAIAASIAGSVSSGVRQDYENARIQHNIKEGVQRAL